MHDACDIPRCRADADMSYLGHWVCSEHWNELTNEHAPPDALRVVLGIEADPEPMTENTTMSKPKNAKKTAEAKPEKKRETKEKVPMRTVALRVPEADFQLLHKAAGERNLSNFMKTTLLAAAQKTLAK